MPDSLSILVLQSLARCIAGLGILLLAACQNSPLPALDSTASSPSGMSGLAALKAMGALCEPPPGWIALPLEVHRRYLQQTWVSPTGDTAYGVVAIRLPLPIGPDLAVWGFLREMRKRYNDGRLMHRQDDPDLPGVRFVAEGGPYRVRTNLILRGRSGWAVYAGTRRDRSENPTELRLAERARDKTRVGVVEQASR